MGKMRKGLSPDPQRELRKLTRKMNKLEQEFVKTLNQPLRQARIMKKADKVARRIEELLRQLGMVS